MYVADTGEKWAYFDRERLTELGVDVESPGIMPGVMLYHPERNRLLLMESVTSHGPIDAKRHHDLARRFAKSKAGLIYVTAFPSRAGMARHLPKIAWETEVWCADSPTHMIHFNGGRFLGPYA